MKKIFVSLVIITMVISPITIIASVFSSNSYVQEESLSSPYVSNAPSIDGSIGFGEWQLVEGLDFTNGVLYAMNDGIRLYLLFDVLSDSGDDPSNDYFWVSFDSDHDGQITPNVDLNYGLVAGNMRYQYYLGEASWTTVQPTTRSSRGIGFGCFVADGTFSFNTGTGFGRSISCSPHKVYEFGFDLDEINATVGSSIDMGFRIYSQNPSFTINYPTNFISDFSSLLTINLGSPTIAPRTPSNVATNFVIPSGEKGIEITQAVQNRMNTLPLVEDKATVARLYVQTSGSGTQPVTTYLYGSRGGIDLPGSPLAKSFNAPSSLNRNIISSSANFDLPKSWEYGTISFSGLVRNAFGYENSHPSFSLSFTPKEVPTVWIIPINTGTTGSPNLVSNSQILSQESAMKAVFPVKDIKFVIKPWTSIGACPGCNLTTIKQKLNQYFAGALFAWIFSGGSFELPDQIYGFSPSGGGSSDPQWYNSGTGLVAAGFLGSSLELTMAHEINHNLDKTPTGTWGRHTGNTNSNTWNWGNGSANPNIDLTWGCGASGTDTSWPTPPNTDDITRTLAKYNVLGFDTRSPQKVVPGNFPDFMSYCQSGSTPTKWVSGYRWEKLFNYFSGPSTAQTSSLNTLNKLGYKLNPTAVEYYQISGTVNKDGSGNLDLVQILIGLSLPAVQQGNANIELKDANGQSVGTYPFSVSFVDVEGEAVDSVPFYMQIPFNPSATEMVLNYQGKALDTFSSTNVLPAVSFTSPKANDAWNGLKEVKWTATNAKSFTLLYSPDNGKQIWEPVASGIKETSYLVDVSNLSPSIQGKFRLIAFNGFNTSETDSPIFEIVNSPPNVDILSPLSDETSFEIGDLIPFKGRAIDSEDGVLPDDQTYWKYGDTPFASGVDVLAVLPMGTHVVTFGAEDSQGAVAEKSITIKVGLSDQTSSSSVQISESSLPGFGFDTFFLFTLVILIGFFVRKRKINL